MSRMEKLLTPIYYQKQVTTKANHYYSPKEQLREHEEELKHDPHHAKHPIVPRWADKMEHVFIPGLENNDDLLFLYAK